jgi:hypothetical protein
MRSRIWALVLIIGTGACNEDLATIAYEIQAPDPPEPVYELGVMEASEGFASWSRGGEGEPVRFPTGGSMGYPGDTSGGDLVQICAIGRGEEDRLLAAVSPRVALVPGHTVRVSLMLAAIEDESEVEPQCQPALVDAGLPPGL